MLRPKQMVHFIRLTLAGLASLAMSHVVQHVLHGATVGQVARPHLPIGLFPPLTLVRVEQEDELLLDELPLLGIGCGRRGPWSYSHCVQPNLGPAD